MSQLRPYDEFFRFGGEKFLYCSPNTDLEQGRAIAEGLREGLARREFAVNGYLPLTVTASFGLALLDSTIQVQTSVDRADQALRAAKVAGRDRIAVLVGIDDLICKLKYWKRIFGRLWEAL